MIEESIHSKKINRTKIKKIWNWHNISKKKLFYTDFETSKLSSILSMIKIWSSWKITECFSERVFFIALITYPEGLSARRTAGAIFCKKSYMSKRFWASSSTLVLEWMLFLVEAEFIDKDVAQFAVRIKYYAYSVAQQCPRPFGHN